MMGDTVLVTGAGGFIGSELTASLLTAGRQVRALDLDLERLRHLEENPGLELYPADLGDEAAVGKALAGVGTVFNLAAAHLGVSIPEAEYWRVNVEAVRTLTSLAGRAKVRRFIHCSSVGVFGRLSQTPADESTICRPELAYERTKLAGEDVVREQAQAEGLPVVILRPVWVYGAGCARTEKLFRAIRQGRFVVAGKGTTLRHCIYIRDMVEAFHLAEISEAATGRTVIVGDNQATTIRDLVDGIARITGSAPPRSVPLGFVEVAALTAELVFRPLGKEPPISRRSLRFFTGNTAFSIERAKALLGFEPRYDLARGLAETHRLLGGGTAESGLDRGLPSH